MSNRHRQARRHKYAATHGPITRSIRDEIGMALHTAMACLDVETDEEAWLTLARIFNIFSVALENDSRHSHEARLIASGAAAMRQVEPKITAKMRLADHERAPIRIAINTMDGLVGRLRLEALLDAMQELDALNAAGVEAA